MKVLIAIAMLSVSVAASGQDRFRSQWSDSCESEKVSFSIDFKSRSGDPEEDDMSVALRWGAHKPVVLTVKPALFVAAEFVGNASSLCKSVGAFKLPSGNILLLIPRDDRPSEDQLYAIVLDGSSGAVVQVVGDLGSYVSTPMIIRDSAGYRLLLLRKWYVNEGRGGGEFGAPDWMSIREAAGHVSYKWETSRP
jgi:hypothetical protein